ncbi:MAG: low affinity iron permease family protein [Rhodospirillales bacterium]
MSHSGFARFASTVSRLAGRPATFIIAAALMAAWAALGPFVGFSETWQLTVNTGTTIVTFLMVFIIQNTQNRDGMALQIKLDELIHATQRAHDALLDLEELSDSDLDAFRRRYIAVARRAREAGINLDDPDAAPDDPAADAPVPDRA